MTGLSATGIGSSPPHPVSLSLNPILLDITQIHHVGLTLDDVWSSLLAIMTGKGGGLTCAPFIVTLKKEVMERQGGGGADGGGGSGGRGGGGGGRSRSGSVETATNSYPVLSISSPDDSYSNRDLSLPLPQLQQTQQQQPQAYLSTNSSRNLSSPIPTSTQHQQPQQQLHSQQQQPLQQQRQFSGGNSLLVPSSGASLSHVPPLSPVHNSKNFCLLFFIQDLLTLAVQEANGYDSRWRVFIKVIMQ